MQRNAKSFAHLTNICLRYCVKWNGNNWFTFLLDVQQEREEKTGEEERMRMKMRNVSLSLRRTDKVLDVFSFGTFRLSNELLRIIITMSSQIPSVWYKCYSCWCYRTQATAV